MNDIDGVLNGWARLAAAAVESCFSQCPINGRDNRETARAREIEINLEFAKSPMIDHFCDVFSLDAKRVKSAIIRANKPK